MATSFFQNLGASGGTTASPTSSSSLLYGNAPSTASVSPFPTAAPTTSVPGTPLISTGNGTFTSIPPASSTPPVSQTIDASAVANNQTSPGITFPSNSPSPSTLASNANSANTSILNPSPSAQSIIETAAAPTPAETKQKTILDRIAGLVGGNKGQQTLTNEAETDAGVPALTKTVNDLSTQIQGLNDQATALANEAAYTIPNQIQLNNQGSGVTKASTAARSADALRLNQIKQGGIATQALTLKAAYYAANGNLTLAKDAADKAAIAQYEDQQQKVDYQKAQLDALAPTLNKEEKAQAAIQQAQLADRQTQIDNAKEDKKTIIGWAVTVLQNNPNDPAAQYAAQQALSESNQEQPDTQKALSMLSKYFADPIAAQQAIADLQARRLQNANIQADTQNKLQPGGGKPPTATQETTALYANRLEQANAIISQLDTYASTANPITFAAQQRAPDFLNALKSGDFQSLDQAQRNFINATLRRESGASISPTEFDSARKQYFAMPGDTPNTVAQKKANRDLVMQGFINGSGSAYTPITTSAPTSGPTKGTDGSSYGHPGYVSDGTQWVKK